MKFQALTPGDQVPCGEHCDRLAVVDLDGLTYCEVCLDRLTSLGSVMADATEEAKRVAEFVEERA